MMRWFLTAALATALLTTGCVTSEKEGSNQRVLVAYFSATGNTKREAQKVATATGGQLFEIVPEVPYTEEDLDSFNDEARGVLECKDRTCRPAIAYKVENFEQYDTVFVGFPIWMYSAPPIIKTFLEQHDTSGKVIVPFVTSTGSSYGETERELQPCAPRAKFLPGKVIYGFNSTQMQQWVNSLR